MITIVITPLISNICSDQPHLFLAHLCVANLCVVQPSQILANQLISVFAAIHSKYGDWKEFLVKRLTGARTLPHNFYDKVLYWTYGGGFCGLHKLGIQGKLNINVLQNHNSHNAGHMVDT